MTDTSAVNGEKKTAVRRRSGAPTRTPRTTENDQNAGGTVVAVTSGDTSVRRRVTARGAATRERIVSAAADLMYIRGVNAVTLDDVRAATGTSKSQLYKHFPDGKTDLIRAVVDFRAEHILAREEQRLHRLKSMSGLRRWRDALMQAAALQGGAYGCALGSLAIEVSDQDEQVRSSLAEHFATWEGLIAAGLRRMQDDGALASTADPDALAVGLMAALQGGYLLAKADHDVAAMATSLDMALAHIGSLTVKPGAAPATQPVRAPKLTAAKLHAAIEAGVQILDARNADDFASGYLRGSLNIGFIGQMAISAATIADATHDVAIITYPDDEEHVVAHLAEAGFDHVIGVFTLAGTATFPSALTDFVRHARRTSPRELEQLLADDAVTVLDTRSPAGRDCGTIANSVLIPFVDLSRELDTIPTDKPIVALCGFGGRSSAAASLLRARGLTQVSDLTGGYAEWQRFIEVNGGVAGPPQALGDRPRSGRGRRSSPTRRKTDADTPGAIHNGSKGETRHRAAR